MQIRDAVPDDAAAVARVHVDSWRTTYVGIIPQSYLDALSYENRAVFWQSHLADRAGGWRTIVAEETGMVVGFAGFGPDRKGSPRFTAELGMLYLLEAYQRRGIGRRLVGEAVRQLIALGHVAMQVWVLEGNTSATFYETLGGQLECRQEVTIGTTRLIELAYGWQDIHPLAGM